MSLYHIWDNWDTCQYDIKSGKQMPWVVFKVCVYSGIKTIQSPKTGKVTF